MFTEIICFYMVHYLNNKHIYQENVIKKRTS